MQAFKEFIWPRKGIVLVGLILIVISRLASLVLPLKSKELLDEIIPNEDIDALMSMVLLVSPNVIVKELEIHYNEGTISAATFGRGVWESPLNTISTSITIDNQIRFKIYPNPAEDKITITTNQQDINVTIFTTAGKKVLETTSKKINTSNFAKGCYIVEIRNKNRFSRRDKLIIK